MPVTRLFKYISLFFLITLPAACGTTKSLTVAATASLLEDVARASYKQSDLKLIREGMPSYLMLIDGMVEALPENKQLLITAAQSYASYASAFIQEEDKTYALALYAKAKAYAIRALEQNGFKKSGVFLSARRIHLLTWRDLYPILDSTYLCNHKSEVQGSRFQAFGCWRIKI